jgi:hypothetical protein
MWSKFFKMLGALAIVYLMVALVGIFVSSFEKPKEVILSPESLRPIVECPEDFASYSSTSKRVVLAENVPAFAIPDKGFVAGKNVSVKRTGLKSQVACGYLFYKVSSGGKPIDQAHMNLYMGAADTQGGIQFGGHILPSERTQILNKNVDGKTEVLMPLNTITYDGRDRRNIFQADWSSLLNVTNQVNFYISLNTIQNTGMIDLVEIAYKCWNPRTVEETTDCELEAL